MQLVAYRNTMAGAKRVVRDQPEQIDTRYLKGRDRLIAISQQYQRRQAEQQAAEQARQERIREQAQRVKERWQKRLERSINLVRSETNPTDLIDMVASWHGYRSWDIFGDSRTRGLVLARHDAIVAVWLNCRLEGRPPTLISMARAFKRDHTSILHALRKRGFVFETRHAALSEDKEQG